MFIFVKKWINSSGCYFDKGCDGSINYDFNIQLEMSNSPQKINKEIDFSLPLEQDLRTYKPRELFNPTHCYHYSLVTLTYL